MSLCAYFFFLFTFAFIILIHATGRRSSIHGWAPDFRSVLIPNDHTNSALVLLMSTTSLSLACAFFSAFVISPSLVQAILCLTHKYIPLVDCIWIVRIKFCATPHFLFYSNIHFSRRENVCECVCVFGTLCEKITHLFMEKWSKPEQAGKWTSALKLYICTTVRVMPCSMYHHSQRNYESVCDWVSVWMFRIPQIEW